MTDTPSTDADGFEFNDADVSAILDAYLGIGETVTDDKPDPSRFYDDGEPKCFKDAECDDEKGNHSSACDAFYFAHSGWEKNLPLKVTGLGSWSHLHDQVPYVLSDGTTVHASSKSRTREGTSAEPDLGIYLDGTWTPACVAFHIGWQDYGLPYVSMEAFRIVADEGLAAARHGKIVEVGCIGGHGRTGTMLAILDVMTMETPDAEAAIRKVRASYCSRAIETGEQEWYVHAWAQKIRGEEITPYVRPVPPAPPKVKAGKAKVSKATKKTPAPKTTIKRKSPHRQAGTSRFTKGR